MEHLNHTNHNLSTGQLAIELVPVIMITTGVTSIMAAKAYQMIRRANSEGRVMEKVQSIND
ncbi:hypothetical protein IV73_GL000396 [Weissella kandleri]|uniref:Uncharacterized protein n=1 Tax=Weissella kandleri TaxID=1616 RepID=A0A0R2JLJ9_9LACO|nr:hypothetical protein [Weissella kandleri]KRN75239.1 hypothetical protein IV73_GL000396 [Weissella kandleri]